MVELVIPTYVCTYMHTHTHTQTTDVLAKAKELLEFAKETVMVPRNLAGKPYLTL